MKNQLQKTIQLLGVICMSGLLAAGCSASPASEPDGKPTVDLSTPATSENAEPAQTQTANANADSTDGNSGSGAETTDSDTGNPDGSTDSGTANADSAEGRWHVLPPDVAAAVDADFEGMVCKITENAFYIAPSETELLENGELLAIGGASDVNVPDSELVQVVFDADTHFYIQTIYDGGARYEDADAAFQDIAIEQMVSLKGSFENDIFHATEIRISKVV